MGYCNFRLFIICNDCNLNYVNECDVNCVNVYDVIVVVVVVCLRPFCFCWMALKNLLVKANSPPTLGGVWPTVILKSYN
jgi:hypothetical protein